MSILRPAHASCRSSFLSLLCILVCSVAHSPCTYTVELTRALYMHRCESITFFLSKSCEHEKKKRDQKTAIKGRTTTTKKEGLSLLSSYYSSLSAPFMHAISLWVESLSTLSFLRPNSSALSLSLSLSRWDDTKTLGEKCFSFFQRERESPSHICNGSLTDVDDEGSKRLRGSTRRKKEDMYVYAYTRESVMMEFQGEFWKVERIQKWMPFSLRRKLVILSIIILVVSTIKRLFMQFYLNFIFSISTQNNTVKFPKYSFICF